MRNRFIRASILAVVAALLAASLLTAFLFERQYTGEVRSRMEAVLALAADRLGEMDDRSPGWEDAFADELAAVLSDTDQTVRFTLIGTDGVVLGDSETDDLAAIENHGWRPEVQGALSDGWGESIRGSTVVDIRYFYAARMASGLVLRVAIPMDHLVYIRWFLAGTGAVGIVIGLALAVVTVTALTRRITKPVAAMAQAARRYADGAFQTRMPPAPDELGGLSAAFNDMADRLERTVSDLEQTNDKLNRVLEGMDDGIVATDASGTLLLLTDRMKDMAGDTGTARTIQDAGPNYRQIQRIMRAASLAREPVREELEIVHPRDAWLSVYATPLHLDRQDGTLAVVADLTHVRKLERIRSEFVSNVTHELKTPLTSIRGYIELLKDGERDRATATQFYEIIEIEAERLQRLIDDILQLSEIEAGPADTPAERVCLADTVRRVVAGLAPAAERAGIRIRTELDPQVCVTASTLRMEQLLVNLVDNAIKYNKDGGEVFVFVRKERNLAVLEVADTGIGIAREHQDRIFERFYRVDKSRSREMGGTGLGLSIVKHIVSLYGGDIRLISEPDEGTRFIVRLPQ